MTYILYMLFAARYWIALLIFFIAADSTTGFYQAFYVCLMIYSIIKLLTTRDF